MNSNAKQYLIKRRGLSMRARNNISKTIYTIVGFTIGLILMVPFIWLVLCSFQNKADDMNWISKVVFPSLIHFDNFVTYFQDENADFLNQLKNTLIITASTMLIGLCSSVLTAYGFSRFRCKAKGVLFMILLSTMMLPWVVTMVPAYAIFSKCGLLEPAGGWLPLIIPSIGGSAYNVFLLRQFFAGIPKDLDEAAKIDGCNSFKILWRILLPNLLPIIATICIFSFIGCWGDYIGPSIYITDSSYFTLALGINVFKSMVETNMYHVVMAGSLIYSIPMIIIFITCQKAYVRGAVGSSVKG